WNVYRQRWPQSYESPAVMWRLEHMEAADSSSSAIELRKKAVGHLIGRTEEERQTMLAQLVSQLGSATKLTLDTIANRYISIDEISGNFQADGLTVGQLSVSMRQRINKSVPSGPLMSHIQYYGGFG
ncbi:MAG: hypothetical protein K0Q59_5727, partial [Paenibacillus sp.]|nr:hypothetical protein [Paenibacillus sp.]